MAAVKRIATVTISIATFDLINPSHKLESVQFEYTEFAGVSQIKYGKYGSFKKKFRNRLLKKGDHLI